MPTGCDLVIVMALAAGLTHRNRSGLFVGDLDGEAALVEQRDQMRDGGTTAVMAVSQTFTLLGRPDSHRRPGHQHGKRQRQDGTSLQGCCLC